MFISYMYLIYIVVLMRIEIDFIILFSCNLIFNAIYKTLWETDEINNLWLYIS